MQTMPMYRSHKDVFAAKIISVEEVAPDSGAYHLVLDNGDVAVVAREWLDRKAPSGGDCVGGYYVVYPPDNYASWSPADKFEAGYLRMPQPLAKVAHTDAELEGRFRYHPPTNDDQRQRHHLVSEKTLELAKLLRDVCPPSRGLSLALTELELVRMWANQAIATNHDLLPAG